MSITVLRAAARNPKTVLYGVARALGGKGTQRYLRMQRDQYERAATLSDFRSGENDANRVVGHYREHDEWPDYEPFLFPDGGGGIALDFACGPGRNIIRFRHLFDRIDGADLAPRNLANAADNLRRNGLPTPKLYLTRGDDLGDAPSDTYDCVFSTIALQHIACRSVRSSIFRHMLRVLKPGGRVAVQMGYGRGKPGSVGYYADAVHAAGTNGVCDVRVENPEQLERDWTEMGFRDFSYDIRPPGPGDSHPNWIFARAVKPRD